MPLFLFLPLVVSIATAVTASSSSLNATRPSRLLGFPDSGGGGAGDAGGVPTVCKLSELSCPATGKCVRQDRFCDGNDDCGDRSDEPRFCSPCNRTYFGEVGTTYDIEVRRPREDRMPFICHLTFEAAGGIYGDLVQLTFDSFTVGRFVSFTVEGCPDGWMHLSEAGLPPPEGRWCGSAWGYTVYYSETPSVTVSLHLLRLSDQGVGYNFDFKLSYKVLPRNTALLRYGPAEDPFYRGELIAGTYCDRYFDDCLNRRCRIQSPNYPGIYPRNVTCRYRISQKDLAQDKHAMIAVQQPNGHKIHIKDQIVKYDRRQRVLKVWDECNIVQDYLTVFDGSSVDSPLLVRLCSGDVVPAIVSSGSEMLVEFRTSPYDNPFHPVPLSYLPGFELEVDVMVVNASGSAHGAYVARGQRTCEFLVTSFEGSSGEVRNPAHSLSPNTTCRYFFQGKAHEKVWLAFTKYHVGSAVDPLYREEECQTRLRLWDGRIAHTGSREVNVTLLGEFCREELPRLCDHALLANASRKTRPCSAQESYLSSDSELTLEQQVKEATALHPVTFHLRYEFIDTWLDGEQLPGGSPCDRIFRGSGGGGSGRFRSPRNVFLFGRGGAQNLSCIYRFQAGSNERVKLHLSKVKLAGHRFCETKYDSALKRHSCHPRTPPPSGRLSNSRSNTTAELWMSEFPWPDVQIPRDCVCSPIPTSTTLLSMSNVLELNLTILMMNISHDSRHFYFEGTYEFVKSSSCNHNLRVRGSSGEIVLRGPSMEEDDCDNQHPWLIEPEDASNFLYLQIQGYEMGERIPCPTKNRITVYPERDMRVSRVICPVSSGVRQPHVDVFSGGWNDTVSNAVVDQEFNEDRPRISYSTSPHGGDDSSSGATGETQQPPPARNVLVEFHARESGSYVVKWMAVSRRPTSSYVTADCVHRCPELNACISADLWCDGVRHCPSGFDEYDDNCAGFAAVPLLYICVGAGALTMLFVLVLSTLVHRCLKRHRKKKKGAKRVPTEEIIIDGKDSIC